MTRDSCAYESFNTGNTCDYFNLCNSGFLVTCRYSASYSSDAITRLIKRKAADYQSVAETTGQI